MNRYLRLFGAIIMVSPIVNFFINVAMIPNAPSKWTWAYMSAMFLAASPMEWALRISKMIIGYLMLRAKSSAWLPVLVILVVTIAYNFLMFSRDFKTNSFQAVSSLMINFVLFGLVLNAEIKSNRELNAKVAAARAARASRTPPHQQSVETEYPAETPEPTLDREFANSNEPEELIPTTAIESEQSEEAEVIPEPIEVEFQVTKGSQIDFEGIGQFAEVVHCNEDELWIRGHQTAPDGITSRPIILESSDSGVSVRLLYLRNDGPDIMVFKVA